MRSHCIDTPKVHRKRLHRDALSLRIRIVMATFPVVCPTRRHSEISSSVVHCVSLFGFGTPSSKIVKRSYRADNARCIGRIEQRKIVNDRKNRKESAIRADVRLREV